MFPSLDDEQKDKLIRLPKNGDDLRAMNEVLQFYMQDHQVLVITAYILNFINFQAFAFPGTAFFAILSGPLFGGIVGFMLCHSCAVAGACTCYAISKNLGSGFVQSRMPQKVAWLQRKIDENRHNLLYYFMFLRLTPLVPNWFLNASSAVVGVPFGIFAGATFFGLMPYSIILVRMGLMIDSISSIGFDASNVLTMFGLGFIALIPTYLTKKEDMSGLEESSATAAKKTDSEEPATTSETVKSK
uniref:VTT domain-containing protein n=1 Tax=Favella ehrenbergii TaxID=182087 RepID=A0A7S3HVZ6_9SPIT|mmetsp:Transcript_343/g.456  ORF Transcript_343/g.456 Transcript_343/m.456 type:complete len:244 (-) Transcript_343:36-767(-)|eukprot:Macronucleus_2417.p1 GENE.Macronucleus_2417~~Macronucleus_2417.p1  ORF type:complete len:244 (+),score=26.48 Macronucleus_2417:1-732(+)